MTGGVDRRRWLRLAPMPGGPASRVRLRTGPELRVCDLSEAGLGVRGQARLLPGLHVDVHVIAADGRRLVRCRVVWSRVVGLAPLEFASALLFEAPQALARNGYAVPIPGEEVAQVGRAATHG